MRDRRQERTLLRLELLFGSCVSLLKSIVRADVCSPRQYPRAPHAAKRKYQGWSVKVAAKSQKVYHLWKRILNWAEFQKNFECHVRSPCYLPDSLLSKL